jgi:hypothetical protein
MSKSNLGLLLANSFGMKSRVRELESGSTLLTTYVRKAVKLGLRPATLCEVMQLCARRKSLGGRVIAILGTKKQSASKKSFEDQVPILKEGPGERKLGLYSKHGGWLSPPFRPGTLFAAVCE